MKHCWFFDGGTCGHEEEHGAEVSEDYCNKCSKCQSFEKGLLRHMEDMEVTEFDLLDIGLTMVKQKISNTSNLEKRRKKNEFNY